MIKKEDIRDVSIDLAIVAELATEAFGDKDLAVDWLHKKNEYFFNESPFDVCLRLGSKSVIEYLKGRLGK